MYKEYADKLELEEGSEIKVYIDKDPPFLVVGIEAEGKKLLNNLKHKLSLLDLTETKEKLRNFDKMIKKLRNLYNTLPEFFRNKFNKKNKGGIDENIGKLYSLPVHSRIEKLELMLIELMLYRKVTDIANSPNSDSWKESWDSEYVNKLLKEYLDSNKGLHSD